MEIHHLLALAWGMIYAVGAICLKVSTAGGIGPWRTAFVSNAVFAVALLPSLFFSPEPFDAGLIPIALTLGTTFFAGQLFTFLALHEGDVSLATPLLGTKVMLVAWFSALLLGEGVGWRLWVASALTTVAIGLLGGGRADREDGTAEVRRAARRRRTRKLLLTILFSLVSAAGFAVTDVLLQHWGERHHFLVLAPPMMAVVMFWSLGLIPFFSRGLGSISPAVAGWLIVGSILVMLQGAGMAFTLATFGHATEVNIVYSARGFWGVLVVWAVGARVFQLAERNEGGNRLMLQRLIGATVLMGAIVLALSD